MKLKSYRKKSDNNPLIRYELNKLQESNTQTEYLLATENRFEALLDTCEEKTPEELWLGMKNIWTEAAENTLGKKKSMKKKPWISTETIELASEKRKARKNNEKGKYIRLRNEIKYEMTNVNGWKNNAPKYKSLTPTTKQNNSLKK
ncbi:reverse transcriptase [Plakobranchus ocellatus]|uniref:Reverse transcriptase n=1 Tax=Plakobranchus ocellatus TaxID=259542 RepID=A0AAV4C2F0_9GAST|nr:reverse transcriptase [Plakobranchus ocellatus]